MNSPQKPPESPEAAVRPARVLLIDDEENSFVITRALLNAIPGTPYDLSWVDSHEAGRAALAAREHDVFLVDYRLGAGNGIDLLRAAVAAGCREPIIMLTGQQDEEVDFAAMKAGAADYLVKGDFDTPRLERAIRYSLERSRLLQALDHERYLLHTLMDSIPDSIYFKDADCRYIRVNKAKARRSNLANPDQAIGKTDAEFFPRSHAERTRKDEERLMQTGEPIIGKPERIVWPNGQVRWVSTTKVPFRDEDGKVVGTLGISRDITDLKQTQDELLAAKDAAESANRAKSDFLANMSHEIRTPMNAILGMTQLVLDTALGDNQREYLAMVLESGRSLMSIINDILDFSKIEAGKLELEEHPFPLRESLGDTMKSLGVQAHRRGIELASDFDPDIPEWLVGDVGRLRQIVVNLVGNGIKFTEQGEVVMEVWHKPLDDRQIELHFTISDTGIGIASEKLESIFDAFEQADSSTTRRFGGTGLGLAITARLVELMQGEIDVESESGKGTRFDLRIPLPVCDEQQPRLSQDLAVVVKGTRVLVVDDNSTNRKIVSEMLQNWGMEAVPANSADDALRKLRQGARNAAPFGMMITDVNMPDTDGFTLVEWVRDDASVADTPVIMLTSGARPEDFERCDKLKVFAHIMKPVKQSELFDVIIAVLGVSGAEDGGAEPDAETPEFPAGRKVLLVEDSLFNQKLAVGLLEKYGQDVTIANNGLEALKALERGRFDLVLMDVQMPEMDGLEATTVIRQREDSAGKRTPIVAMTAHALKGDKERCLEAGMDAYVSKPIHIKDLAQAMHDVLAPAAAEASPESESGPSEPHESPGGIVDWDRALQNVEGRRELLVELIEIFFTEQDQAVDQLREAVQAEDSSQLKAAAHRLKGCLRYFGESPVADAALELENLGRSGSVDGAAELLKGLEDGLGALRPELEKFARRYKS